MRGRIFGIKKSTILKISGWANLSLIIFFVLFSIFVLKNDFLWFFFFSFFVGVHLLTKSALFGLDSACFLGFLLLFVGVAGFCSYYFDLPFKYFYFLSSLGLASIFTFFFFGQRYQLFSGLLVCTISLLSYLYCLKILNLALFLVTSLSFFFIFSALCAILIAGYFKK